MDNEPFRHLFFRNYSQRLYWASYHKEYPVQIESQVSPVQAALDRVRATTSVAALAGLLLPLAALTPAAATVATVTNPAATIGTSTSPLGAATVITYTVSITGPASLTHFEIPEFLSNDLQFSGTGSRLPSGWSYTESPAMQLTGTAIYSGATPTAYAELTTTTNPITQANSLAFSGYTFQSFLTNASFALGNTTTVFLVDPPIPSATPAPTAVPEPASVALLGAGLLGLAGVRRRKA